MTEPTSQPEAQTAPTENTENSERSYFGAALILAAVIAITDQATKLWILNLFDDGYGVVNVIGDFFRLTLVYNYGGALGTNLGSPTVYLIMGLLVFSGLLYYLWNVRRLRWLALTLGLITGGAIGNLTDRVRLGKVVDWIDIDIPDIPWFGGQLERFWTFNIADSAITVALAFILWKYLREKPDLETETNSTEPTLDKE